MHAAGGGAPEGDDVDRTDVWKQVVRTRVFYRVGVLLFLAGLALAVAPVHRRLGVEDWFRWGGTAIAGAVCVFECCWMARDAWMRVTKKGTSKVPPP
jgi:hypothetical protein